MEFLGTILIFTILLASSTLTGMIIGLVLEWEQCKYIIISLGISLAVLTLALAYLQLVISRTI